MGVWGNVCVAGEGCSQSSSPCVPKFYKDSNKTTLPEFTDILFSPQGSDMNLWNLSQKKQI